MVNKRNKKKPAVTKKVKIATKIVENENQDDEIRPKLGQTDENEDVRGQKFNKAKKISPNSRSSIAAKFKQPPPIKGLSNLGNTCFFNSVVQNLMQTHQLEELLVNNSSLNKGAKLILKPLPYVNICQNFENHENFLSPNEETSSSCGSDNEKKARFNFEPLTIILNSDLGNLTTALRSIYQDFKNCQNSSILTPSHLLDQVCKKAPRFKGFQQQDSHELLRYLLDALRNEQRRRLRMAVLEAFNLPSTAQRDQISPKIRQCLKAYDRAAEVTCVEQVFGGELIQCIKCKQCGHVSSKFESFLDLSLPIVENKRALFNPDNMQIRTNFDSNRKSNYSVKKEKKLARKQAKASTTKGRRKSGSTGDEGQNLNGSSTVENEDIKTNGEPEVGQNPKNEDNLPDDIAAKLEFFLDIDDDSEDQNAKSSMVASNKEKDPNPTISEKLSSQNDIQRYPEVNGGGPPTVFEKSIDNADLPFDQSDSFYNNNNNNNYLDKWDSFMTPLNSPSPSLAGPPNSSHMTACLAQFMAPEVLDGKNKFGCEFCSKNHRKNLSSSKNDESVSSTADKKLKTTVYTDALKQYLIYSPPAVLTLHLKRFLQDGGTLKKISKHVEFPLILDLGPFCSKNGKRVSTNSDKILYSLYGIVSHSGRLVGGHYVAYVKLSSKSAKNRSKNFLQSNFSWNLNDLSLSSQTNSLNLLINNHDFNNNNNQNSISSRYSDNLNGFLLNKIENFNQKIENFNEKNGKFDEKNEKIEKSDEKFDKTDEIIDNSDEKINKIDQNTKSDNSAPSIDKAPLTPPNEDKWFLISDSHVTEVSVNKVLNCEAYLLFYDRIE